MGEGLISSVPDVSRLLERMEDMGAVSRERDDGDRRHVTARITDAGRRLLDAVTPELEVVERARFSRLSALALRAMITALAHVRETA